MTEAYADTMEQADILGKISTAPLTDTGDRLEHMFHLLRIISNFKRQLAVPINQWPKKGGLYTTPSWVSFTTAGGSVHTASIFPSIEPGEFIPPPGAPLEWSVRTVDLYGRGTAYLQVGISRKPPALAPPVFHAKNGRIIDPDTVPWASRLSPVIRLPICTREDAHRLMIDTLRQEEPIREIILEHGMRTINRVARAHISRLPAVGAIYGREDIVQQGLIRMNQAIDRFASPNRPYCSWGYYCQQEIYKDAQRTMAKAGGESVNMSYIRAWLWSHPTVHTPQEAYDEGLSPQYRPAFIQQAIEHHYQVSLDNPVWKERTGDSAGTDHNPWLAYTDPELENDPLIGQRFKTILAKTGIDIAELEPWLYKIGALDTPHTNKEVYSRYGKRPYQIAATESRFFSSFAVDGESWSRPSDRPKIRDRAKKALLGED